MRFGWPVCHRPATRCHISYQSVQWRLTAVGNDIPNVKTKDSWYTVGIICQTPPMLSRNHLLAHPYVIL